MHASNILMTALAALGSFASAGPARRADTHSVTLNVIVGALSQNPPVSTQASVEINVLTPLGDDGISATSLELSEAGHTNVDITKVECRAFMDAAGQKPGSAPFNYKTRANLATHKVTVGSVLCYLVSNAEAAEF